MTGPGGRSDEPRTWFVDPLTGQPLETEAEQTLPIPVVRDTATRRRLRLRPTLGVLGLVIVLVVGTTATYQARTAPPPSAQDLVLPDPVTPTRIEPVIAGWQPVQSDDHPLVFDAPPDWNLEEPDVAIGYETPAGELVTLQGVARYHRDFCPGSDLSARAMAGFTTIDEGEVGGTAQAAEETTLRWAEAAYGPLGEGQPPKTEIGKAAPVTMLDGGATATAVTTTVVPAADAPCPAPSVAITAIALPLRALPGSGRYHVLLVLADQGIPDAVARDIVLKMGATIRRE
ncbi:hypothetical protein [Amycolatopsis azurea]|uniref:DUF8017 domain-containing protein n=1 Tax=Amycolatopsis azurea DSM 43854 TaxID=1238180 RepID=M2NYU1_9PSEU|nr:hypothetical protein [Amycolatopsis azurea]EMD27814.1 hypothetical protein C791_1711 [Amycolatopsis azurea DSM 43854]OOC03301.1 hypothetical protein B0293_27400 [Amycolatopsis azurea DSM 43854]